MRCNICDAESTWYDKRDRTYICDECRSVVAECVAEFELPDEYFNVKQKLTSHTVSLKEETIEDSPDLP